MKIFICQWSRSWRNWIFREQLCSEIMLKLKELQVHHMIKTPQHGLYKISVSSKSHVVSNSLIFLYNFETDLRLKELFVDGL